MLLQITEKVWRKTKGAPGFEPGTSRSAVECSTTELYPLHTSDLLLSETYVMMTERFYKTGPAHCNDVRDRTRTYTTPAASHHAW